MSSETLKERRERIEKEIESDAPCHYMDRKWTEEQLDWLLGKFDDEK